MQLSKGQLKRIIREEYVKLQRKGLISEAGGRRNNSKERHMAQEIVENECEHETILSIASYGKESEFAYNFTRDGMFDQIQLDEIQEALVELQYQDLVHQTNLREAAMDLWDICVEMEDRIRYEMKTL